MCALFIPQLKEDYEDKGTSKEQPTCDLRNTTTGQDAMGSLGSVVGDYVLGRGPFGNGSETDYFSKLDP